MNFYIINLGIGYSGITKAYVAEVDLYYNKEFDTAANTFAIKQCFTSTCNYNTPGPEKTFTPAYNGKNFYQADIRFNWGGKSNNFLFYVFLLF